MLQFRVANSFVFMPEIYDNNNKDVDKFNLCDNSSSETASYFLTSTNKTHFSGTKQSQENGGIGDNFCSHYFV